MVMVAEMASRVCVDMSMTEKNLNSSQREESFYCSRNKVYNKEFIESLAGRDDWS